jgi:hypothetical protein
MSLNELNKGTTQKRSISQVFVFLLLGVFAVFSTFMVLLGAQLYRGTVDQTEQHSDKRLLFSYVTNAVRGNDAADLVYVDNRGGIDMLVFGLDADGERYETMIYCYDGTLRELFIDAQQEFEPDYGEIICNAGAFVPQLEDGLLTIAMEDSTGSRETLHIALRCSQEEHNE